MQEGRLKPYYLSYNLQLFAKEGQDGEKTEEPTAKKLEDARKKGQVMRSTEVVTAATLLVFFLMLKVFVGFIGNRFISSYHKTLGSIGDYTSDYPQFPVGYRGSGVSYDDCRFCCNDRIYFISGKVEGDNGAAQAEI